MSTINGIGTKLIGKYYQEANSFVSTKWFVLMGFPIFPLGTYKVFNFEKENLNTTLSPLSQKVTKFQSQKIMLDKKEVLNIYLKAYGIVIIGGLSLWSLYLWKPKIFNPTICFSFLIVLGIIGNMLVHWQEIIEDFEDYN